MFAVRDSIEYFSLFNISCFFRLFFSLLILPFYVSSIKRFEFWIPKMMNRKNKRMSNKYKCFLLLFFRPLFLALVPAILNSHFTFDYDKMSTFYKSLFSIKRILDYFFFDENKLPRLLFSHFLTVTNKFVFRKCFISNSKLHN